MDSKERAEIIRHGNAAFNEKDYAKAKELFTVADYADGLVRLGDYYMFERRLPLLAYGYYRKANAKAKVDDIRRRMISAISVWLGKDKIKEESLAELSGAQPVRAAAQTPVGLRQPAARVDGMIPVPVSSELRALAQKLMEKG